MSILEKIEFHDSSLLSLELNLENSILILFVEVEAGTSSLKLCFSKVDNFYIDRLDDFKDIQIFSSNFHQENGVMVANFVLLNGYRGKSYNLIFHYLECKIDS